MKKSKIKVRKKERNIEYYHKRKITWHGFYATRMERKINYSSDA